MRNNLNQKVEEKDIHEESEYEEENDDENEILFTEEILNKNNNNIILSGPEKIKTKGRTANRYKSANQNAIRVLNQKLNEARGISEN